MTYSIWFLIVPLLLFAIVDSFATMKTALIVAALGALGEVVFTYFYFGELDSFSVASVFLVLLMCSLAFLKDSRKIFYLKPALLSFGFGLYLTVTYLMGEYVLYDGYTKYSHLFDIDTQSLEILGPERIERLFKKASITTGIGLILHSIVATYAALKLSRWWWFAIAGLGSYVFLFVSMIFAGLI